MHIKKKQGEIDRGKTEAIDDEQRRELILRDPGRGGNWCSEKAVQTQVEKKLERIDVEKDEEQQDAGKKTGQPSSSPKRRQKR